MPSSFRAEAHLCDLPPKAAGLYTDASADFAEKRDVLVLDPSSEFFRYLNKANK